MKKLIILAMLAMLPAVAQAAPHHKPAPKPGHQVHHGHHKHKPHKHRPHKHHAHPHHHHGPHCVVPAPRPCPPPPPVHHCNHGSNISFSISL